ncbi:MAG: CHAT domain-containing protein [Bacteroidia bacterium]
MSAQVPDAALARLQMTQGDSLIREGEFPAALQSYQRSLDTWKQLDSTARIVEVYFLLGRGLIGVPDYDGGLRYLDSALSLARTRDLMTLPILGRVYYMQAYAYDDLGQYARAIEVSRLALHQARRYAPQDSVQQGAILNVTGVLWTHLGRFDSARTYLEQALDLRRQIGVEAQIGETLVNLGNIWIDTGVWDQARSYYQQAYDLFARSQGKDHPYTLTALENIALSYYYDGEPREALVLYEQVLHQFWDLYGPDHPKLGSVYQNMGTAHYSLRDYDAAARYYNLALKLVEEYLGPVHPTAAELHSNLASIESRRGHTDAAVQRHRLALQIARQLYGDESLMLAEFMGNFAETYQRMGDDEQALYYARQALRVGLAAPGGEYSYQSVNYQDIAALHLRMGQPDSARYYAQQAIGVHWPGYGIDLRTPAPPLFSLHQPSTFFYAVAQMGEILTQPSYLDDDATTAQGLAHLRLAIDLLDSLRITTLSTDTWLALSEETRAIYDRCVSVAWQRYQRTGQPADRELAWYAAEKSSAALLFFALQDTHAKHIAGIPPDLLAYERSLDQRMIQLRRQIDEELAQDGDTSRLATWRASLFALFQAKDSLVRGYRRHYPGYYGLRYDAAVPTLRQVQRGLPPGTGMIRYHMGDGQLWCWYLRADTVVWQVVPWQATEDSLLQSLLDQLSDPGSPDLEELFRRFGREAHALYRILMPPLPGSLPARLVVIPDDKLSYLPFELLLAEPLSPQASLNYAALSYLSTAATISYDYAARLWMLPHPDHRGQGYGGFAPVYPDIAGERYADARRYFAEWDRAFRPLAHNQDEVATVAQRLGGRAYLGLDATIDAFRTEAPAFDVLHLAMHAFTSDEKPLYSGLVFTPQARTDSPFTQPFLHAYELLGIQLRARLAILSACNTGTGRQVDGEGVMGLHWAFRYAGCPATMPTLWSVDDAAMRELMTSFFEHYAAGEDAATALRAARQSYVRRYPQAHPGYWGGMILVGQADSPARPSPFNRYVYLAVGLMLFALPFVWWLRRRRPGQ